MGLAPTFDLPYLESYYRRCVIGGPGAFVLSVGDLRDFEKAIRRKFLVEISGVTASPTLSYASLALGLHLSAIFSTGDADGLCASAKRRH
jgi:Protein of unknown function (DUF1194)